MRVFRPWEAIMVRKPKPANVATEQIARINPFLVWWPGYGCPCTDIAVGGYDYSEYFLEQDETTQTEMLEVRLQAEADVHKVVSEASAKMAGVLKAKR
jgi:hypothetical protein